MDREVNSGPGLNSTAAETLLFGLEDTGFLPKPQGRWRVCGSAPDREETDSEKGITALHKAIQWRSGKPEKLAENPGARSDSGIQHLCPRNRPSRALS